MDEVTKNVVARFQDKEAMATLIHNVAGHDWGWFSREDQRMHLQTVESGARIGPKKAKVWLENKGKRIFELAMGTLSGPDLKRLKAKIDSERKVLESRWVAFMVLQGWIKAELRTPIIVVTAYPNTHNKFTRELDLRKLQPGVSNWDTYIVDFDDHGMLRFGNEPNPDHRDNIPLEDFLFV
jgi:hypothetical protein